MEPQWLTAVRDYAGQKLAVRLRPSSAISDADRTYSYLFVVTQHLACVNASGMPEADYNDSLRLFDGELIGQLEIDGRVVVVETYAGKRIYYAYVGDEKASKECAERVLSKHGLLSEASFRGGQDATWKFYARYSTFSGTK